MHIFTISYTVMLKECVG